MVTRRGGILLRQRSPSRKPRFVVRWLWLSVLLVSLSLAGSQTSWTRQGAKPGLPNIALILIDQLRADRLGIHGHDGNVAPNMDRIAREGFYFSRARSAAPWTYPSVCSLLTGLYPRVHKADILTEADRDQFRALPLEVNTLQEYLKSVGYSTAGFITNHYLRPGRNVDQGFDHYEYDFFDLNPKKWLLPSSYADTVNRRVLAYTRTRRSSPQFYYIHYIDVHGPWDFAPFAEGIDIKSLSEEEQYHLSIRYMDEKIGELFSELNRLHEGNLLFIVTSDHGRRLTKDDHSSDLKINKASLHEFNLRVPLIIAGTRFMSYRGSSAANVSLIDVVPTILEMIGYDGRVAPEVDGVSLMPLMRGGRIPPRVLYAENTYHRGCTTQGAIDGATKYVNVTGPKPLRFLYDLAHDPLEMALPLGPLSAGQRAHFSRLARALDAMDARALEGETIPIDEETRERLRALGYVHN